MAEYFIPHGTSENLDFRLQDVEDGDTAKQNIDLTGLTVTIDVLDRNLNAVTLAGTVSIVTAASGDVRYAPADADDFDNYETQAPWYVRWKVSDGGSPEQIFYVPNTEERDLWIVRP